MVQPTELNHPTHITHCLANSRLGMPTASRHVSSLAPKTHHASGAHMQTKLTSLPVFLVTSCSTTSSCTLQVLQLSAANASSVASRRLERRPPLCSYILCTWNQMQGKGRLIGLHTFLVAKPPLAIHAVTGRWKRHHRVDLTKTGLPGQGWASGRFIRAHSSRHSSKSA